MSNNDSFIDEVTEEVRKDKLFALMRKYGWIAIVAVIAVVGGAAWNEWQKVEARASAEAFGDSLLAAIRTEDPAARVAAIEALQTTPEQGAIVDLLISAEALAGADRARAADALRAVASDATLPVAYRHLASLRLVLVLGDEMDPAARDTALAELATPGAPFRTLALEQQALVLAADGKNAEALALLQQVLQEPDVTPTLRRRVSQAIVALGGEVAAG